MMVEIRKARVLPRQYGEGEEKDLREGQLHG
jgi:hypothetical protein